MKGYFLFLAVLLASIPGRGKAQDSTRNRQEAATRRQGEVRASFVIENPNIIKLNLVALGVRGFSVQYERAIVPKIALTGTVSIMPEGGNPLPQAFLIPPDIWDKFSGRRGVRVAGARVMASARYYTGKYGAPRGFYLAPYLRFARHWGRIGEFEYSVASPEGRITRSIPAEGKLNKFTAGMLLGAQFRLGKMIYLDWWIVGVAAGPAGGEFKAEVNLSPEEQAGIRNELESLELERMRKEIAVNGNGARLDISGTWIDMRIGMCLGIRF